MDGQPIEHILVHKNMFRFKNTQISIFFIVLISIILIITMITVNIGKISLDKTYTANSADAGALSAASVMAYAFNYVAEANKKSRNEAGMESNWERFQNTYKKHFHQMEKIYNLYKEKSDHVKEKECCTPVAEIASRGAERAADIIQRYIDEINELIKGGWEKANSKAKQQGKDLGIIPNYAHLQESFYKAIRERVHDDKDGKNDLYNIALLSGYRFNFYNSGFFKKIGEDANKFLEFINNLNPKNVTNCQPITYNWTDNANRNHIVKATVCIRPVRTYKLKKTKMDRSEIKDKLDEAKDKAKQAKSLAMKASSIYSKASGCDGCCDDCPHCCPGYDKWGDSLMKDADSLMAQANNLSKKVEQGLDETSDFTSKSENDTSNIIIKYIEDIDHDRRVTSSQYQEHQGRTVESATGELNFSTYYPPVSSTSIASFEGKGSIHPQKPWHDASLTYEDSQKNK